MSENYALGIESMKLIKCVQAIATIPGFAHFQVLHDLQMIRECNRVFSWSRESINFCILSDSLVISSSDPLPDGVQLCIARLARRWQVLIGETTIYRKVIHQ